MSMFTGHRSPSQLELDSFQFNKLVILPQGAVETACVPLLLLLLHFLLFLLRLLLLLTLRPMSTAFLQPGQPGFPTRNTQNWQDSCHSRQISSNVCAAIFICVSVIKSSKSTGSISPKPLTATLSVSLSLSRPACWTKGSGTRWSHPLPRPLYSLQNYLPTNFTSPRRGARIFRGGASENGVMRVEILSAFSLRSSPQLPSLPMEAKKETEGIVRKAHIFIYICFQHPNASQSQRRRDGTCRQKTVWLNIYENPVWLLINKGSRGRKVWILQRVKEL